MNIGSVIMSKRKALGYTQQTLANKLNVSFQEGAESGSHAPELSEMTVIIGVRGGKTGFKT